MTAPLEALWPPPATLTRSRSLRGTGHCYLAVPSARAPRLLVPVGVPGAERMLARHGGGRRTRVARALLTAAHRGGLSAWAPMPRLQVETDPAGIERHLATVMGQPVRLGVLLGPPRANLKPVLQVFAEDGGVLAFAKVATSAVTTPLLTAEAAALRRLAHRPVPGVTVPELVELGTWRDRLVLVQRALPAAQSGRQPTALPAAELAAITASEGLRRGTLAGSPFWGRVSDVGDPTWHGLDVSAFARLRSAVDEGSERTFGAWHGDFGPWNAAWGGSSLEVWDWERYETDVPAGLDAAHWRVQLDVGKEPASAWLSAMGDVGTVLRAAQDSSDPGAVAACYVLAIWSRYRADAANGPTPALRARVSWLCRFAEAGLPTLREVRR